MYKKYEIIELSEDSKEQCEYCGAIAHFQIGKKLTFCCKETLNACPAIREKNSVGHQKSTIRKKYEVSYSICTKCGRSISLSNFEKHDKVCAGPKNWIKSGNEYICKICGQISTKSGIGNHVKYHAGYVSPLLGKPGWNKGLTLATNESIKKQAITYKGHIADGSVIPSFKGRTHSQATREKWKQNPNMGGKRERSGRGKKGKYLGYYCDSTWELAWLIQVLDEGKVPIRNTKGFEYLWQGEIHKYYPDFLLNGEYVEIKGQKGPQWDAKLHAWKESIPLRIVDKNEIKSYIKYAEAKFGKEFWVQAYGNSFTQTIFKPGS